MRVASALIVVALCTVGLMAWSTKPFSPERSCCDHLFYRSMAYNLFYVTRPDLNVMPRHNRLASVYRDPYFSRFMSPRNALNRQPPYVYRPLTPLLARTLTLVAPLSIEEAFRVLTFVSLAAATALLGLCVWQLSAVLWLGMLAEVCFVSFAPLVRFDLHEYMLVDPLALAFLIAGIWLMIQRRTAWFLIIVAVGLLNKETQLFLLPAAIILDLLWGRLRWHWLAAYCAIGAVYIGVRLAVPVPVDTYGLRTVFYWPGLGTLVSTVLVLFGPLLPLAVVRGWRRSETLALLPIALAAVGTSFFASNTARVVALAAPIVLIAALTPPRNSPRATAMTLIAAFTFIAVWEVHTPLVGVVIGVAVAAGELLGGSHPPPAEARTVEAG